MDGTLGVPPRQRIAMADFKVGDQVSWIEDRDNPEGGRPKSLLPPFSDPRYWLEHHCVRSGVIVALEEDPLAGQFAVVDCSGTHVKVSLELLGMVREGNQCMDPTRAWWDRIRELGETMSRMARALEDVTVLPVTREGAARIAQVYIGVNPDWAGYDLIQPQDVRDVTEIGRRLRPQGVDLGAHPCWIAYIREREPRIMLLRSSTIIAIDKATGLIRYSGNAYDEG